MTDEIKNQEAGTADKVKLGVAVAIVIAGVAGYYFLADQAAWLRWLAVVVRLEPDANLLPRHSPYPRYARM